MARLDFATATPFRMDECILVKPSYRVDDPESIYAILRRDHVAPLVESLASARIALCGLALATPRGLVRADGPSLAALGNRPRRERLLRGGARMAAVLALIGLLGLGATWAWRQEQALAALDREIARAEIEAAQVRADMHARAEEIVRIAAVRGAKSGALPLVRVLEELALTLPDGTWLNRVDVDESTVLLTGTSTTAAGLIPLLEASPVFGEATFTQPVLRTSGEAGERFTIALQAESADG
ncbi:Tfp pilus assembly protein PilN [Palleronia marisminoris]|uniref:Fimbrial assembly protein (PilN) n=1 Tax=Palleronia marisminoris TaxID=315423 RepID=A0A1Y5T6B8_9RHOB|nr:PilN domain-containing protein [Palleronia marisminoris]SFH20395.1 Tfp pilus assembly protein PilN [Palleronia marisminoris]SLN56908.1 Fimbrial assembly protein (PilN) [Palleronia marisminoris]